MVGVCMIYKHVSVFEFFYFQAKPLPAMESSNGVITMSTATAQANLNLAFIKYWELFQSFRRGMALLRSSKLK